MPLPKLAPSRLHRRFQELRQLLASRRRARLSATTLLLATLAAIALPTRTAHATAYFGDLHAHSALSDDATNPPEQFFRVARDVAGLDFVVLSDHDAFLTDNEFEILK